MATEIQTLEPDTNCDGVSSSQLVQQGRLALRRLQHAAHVARLEAQALELEAAIDQAEQGQPAALALWLARNTADAREEPAPTTTPTPTNEHEHEHELGSGSADEEVGWARYLPAARERLRAVRAVHGPAQPWLDQPVVLLQTSSAEDQVITDQPQIREPNSDEFFSDAPYSDRVAGSTHWPEVAEDEESAGTLDDVIPDDVLSELTTASAPEAQQALGSTSLRKRIFGSYGCSVLSHLALLVFLGTMTLKSPVEGNSLGSQVLTAAEARSDVELSSEVELLEPTEVAVTEPMPASVEPSSVAKELSQLAQSVSAVNVDVAVSTSVGSTIASAISEATSQSSAGARSGGVPSLGGKFFGVGTGGNYFCYVVDRSGSMRGGAWESAKGELVRSLKSLKATQKFYIIFFADEFEALPEPGSDQPASTGLYATPENIEHARQWIQSVQLNRGGPPNEALAWAIDREPDAIYLLTDGVTKVDVCGYLRKANRLEDIVSGPQVRVPIHAIAYHSLEGQQLMRQLAKENQGQFIYVPKPKK